jgi:hypothetical protein
MALEKLPYWVPEVGTLVEITPVSHVCLSDDSLNYRAKVISVERTVGYNYKIQLAGHKRKIIMEREIKNGENVNKTSVAGWISLFDLPVHLYF